MSSTFSNVATRIQSSGGSSVVKFIGNALVPSSVGEIYENRVSIYNQGLHPVLVSDNFSHKSSRINPGQTKRVVGLTYVGDGVANASLRFETLNVDDTLDIVAYSP